MNVSKEVLKSHYQRLTDRHVERLANYEAGDLIPEAFDILKEEIKRRGLSDELDKAADMQVRGISEVEEYELIRKISSFPCPACGEKQNHINCLKIMSVGSYTIEKTLMIACPDCISKSAKSALLRNLLLGWWAIPFPWGPIKTIESIFVNLKAINYDNYNEPTKEFIEFIRPHSAVVKSRMEKIKNMEDLFNVIQPA